MTRVALITSNDRARSIVTSRTLAWLAFTALAVPSAVEAQSNDGWFYASSVRPHFDENSHIGPDARNIRYEWAGRFRAAAGGEIVAVGHRNRFGIFGLTLGGLLALENDSPEMPVPFQLLRAGMGIGIRGATHWLRKDETEHRATMLFAFDHESDHFASEGAADYHTLARRVDIDNFSSYEYFRIVLGYELKAGNFWLGANLGTRLFTRPVNAGGAREQRFSFEFELRLRLVVATSVALYASGFAEMIDHGLSLVALPTLPNPMSCVRGEVGVSLGSGATQLDFYTGVTALHGRGIDFLQYYPPAFLLGTRASF